MQRWQTWLVVAAVGIVAALAVADALRGDGAKGPPLQRRRRRDPRRCAKTRGARR